MQNAVQADMEEAAGLIENIGKYNSIKGIAED